MSLNPLRDALGTAGFRASQADGAFKPVVEAAMADFEATRRNLERRVREGELTVKVARSMAQQSAAELKKRLQNASDRFSPVPASFLDRLVEVSARRARAREQQSAESLQRETNRLLRQALVEQQIQNRAVEFEGRTFLRPVAGGVPAPTLESLLNFHRTAEVAGDEAAIEWVRRQLEGFRNRVMNSEDLRRIDLACDRPEYVNPRLVKTYVDHLEGRDPEELETFVTEAVDSRDANACVAAFVIARQTADPVEAPWVRRLLQKVESFPDAAIKTLRSWESEVRETEAQSARHHVDFAAALAEAEAQMTDLKAPSDEELARRSAIFNRPAAQPGEPVGLSLQRRGYTQAELEGLAVSGDPDAGPDLATEL